MNGFNKSSLSEYPQGLNLIISIGALLSFSLFSVKFNIEVNKAALEKCSSSEPNQGTCSNANCTKWIVLSIILFVGLLTESAYLVFRKK